MDNTTEPTTADSGGQSLSRLDCEKFMRSREYAVAYWGEHKENFDQALNQLFEDATLLKIAADASVLALRYNHQQKTIPPDYNQKIILEAYEVLEQKLTKQLLSKAMHAWMEVLEKGLEEQKAVDLSELFSTEQAKNKLAFLAEFCMKEGYDQEMCYKYFMPQLLLFFLRFLHIYDGSLQGALVPDYLHHLRQLQLEAKWKDDKQVKNLWQKMKEQKQKQEKVQADSVPSAQPSPSSSGLTISPPPKPEEEEESKAELLLRNTIFSNITKSGEEGGAGAKGGQGLPFTQQRMGAKNELHFLQKSTVKGKELLSQCWKEKSALFLNKWEGMPYTQRRTVLADARAFLLTVGQGSYATALLYCPELSPDDLAGPTAPEQTTPAPTPVSSAEDGASAAAPTDVAPPVAADVASPNVSGGETKESPKREGHDPEFALTFIKLLKRCLLDEPGKADPFVQRFLSLDVRKRLAEAEAEASEKSGAKKEEGIVEMITICRQFMLLTYVSKVISSVLEIPFEELAPVTSLLAPLKEKAGPKTGSLFEQSPDLRMCANPECEKFEATEKSFQVCSFCRRVGRIVPYCSRECQAKDWNEHKKLCGKEVAPQPRPTPAPGRPVPNRPQPVKAEPQPQSIKTEEPSTFEGVD